MKLHPKFLGYPFFSAWIILFFIIPQISSATTLCQDYGNLNFTTTLGTTITQSSQIGSSISGNIYIAGDFEINNNFSFTNCIIKIAPGVKIDVNALQVLTLDNAKLFSCNQMWEGINMGTLTNIFFKNNTHVEDAEKAVYATIASIIFVENTTFNRNNIAIELDRAPNLPDVYSPYVNITKTNTFSCTDPLNGTTNGVSFAGIKTTDASISVGGGGFTTFNGLKNGIYALSSMKQVTLTGQLLKFEHLEDNGIYIEDGSLDLTNSTIKNCENRGIKLQSTVLVSIKNCDFIYDSNSPNLFIYGIDLANFSLNSDVNIEDNDFDSGVADILTSILLNGGNVGSGTQISIHGNSFDAFDIISQGQAINVTGNFNSSSDVDIYNNQLRIEPQGTNVQVNWNQTGIGVNNGTKNNLSIISNDFFRIYGGPVVPGVGIRLLGSTGTNNEVSGNNFPKDNFFNVFQDKVFGDAIRADNFQNTKFCSNTIADCFTYFYFRNINPGTNFESNTMIGDGQGLEVDGITGPQIHRGNKWLREVSFAQPTNFASLESGNPEIQQITVHTPPTTTSVSIPSYFPERVSPTSGWFITDPNGSPSSGCISQFTSSSVAMSRSTPIENSLHRAIVDGSIQDLEDNSTTVWILEEYLYNQLKKDQTLAAKSEDFSFFETEKQRTNVGAFFNISEGIDYAFKADISSQRLSGKYIERLKIIIKELRNIDTQMGEQELAKEKLNKLISQKESLIIELEELEINFSKLEKEYRAKVADKLSIFPALNSQISSNAIYEENEQRLNEVYLKSIVEQDRIFTKEQLEIIREIAAQCPKYGGMPVYEARGMLPIEEQHNYNDNREDCYPIDNSPEKLRIEPPTNQLSKIESKLSNEVSIYPNPANQVITVDLGEEENARIIISNTLGLEVINISLNQKSTAIQLDDNFNTGIYNCTLYLRDGTIKNKKLMINK